MTQKLLLYFGLAGLFCITSPLYAQKPMPGYVVTAGRDSLLGAIQVHDAVSQQLRVEFIPAQGHQRLFLDAYQLAAYGYIRQQDTARYVAIACTVNEQTKQARFFLRQLVGGPVQLLDYHYVQYPDKARRVYLRPIVPFNRIQGHQLPVHRTLVVYRQGETSMQEVAQWKFPLDAAAYFADCPALATDLRAGQYRSRDIRHIVRRYNSWYRTVAYQR